MTVDTDFDAVAVDAILAVAVSAVTATVVARIKKHNLVPVCCDMD